MIFETIVPMRGPVINQTAILVEYDTGEFISPYLKRIECLGILILISE
jgi:hypothetical protein